MTPIRFSFTINYIYDIEHMLVHKKRKIKTESHLLTYLSTKYIARQINKEREKNIGVLIPNIISQTRLK